MNELVEKLLKPVSAEQPCGPDLSDKPAYDELARILKGKPSIQVGSVEKPAEPPDWRELRAKSTEYLTQSKHLRAAMMFCGSSLQISGLPGFRDGLQLIRGLIEQYWPTIHPPLDVEDNNDPTQRLNILGALNSPRGTLRPDIQQWLAIIDYLYTAPLCRPKGADPVTLDLAAAAHRRAENKPEAPSSEGTPPPPVGMDLAQLAKAFRAAPPAEIEANHVAVSEALEALAGLDQFLTQTLGSGNTISFDELQKVLKELQSVLQTHLPGSATEVGTISPDGNVERPSGDGSSSAISISGAVRSREDVVRMIDAICEYYRQVEPSSPVPYLLKRAQKVARMNFVESMQELNLASVDALRPSMGTAVDSDPLAS
jgi:type VI secretion system protein ImpA